MKHKIKIIYLLILIVMLYFSAIEAYSQTIPNNSDTRKTQIDSILFKGNILYNKDYDNLILSSKDSLIFYYSCLAKNGKKNPFLFRIKLKIGDDSSNHVNNNTRFQLAGMSENKYTLTIQAFDPNGQWEASPAIINFEVNDKFAELKSELDSLKNLPKMPDTSHAASDKQNTSYSLDELILYSSGISIALILSLMLIFLKTKRKKEQKKLIKTMPQSGNNGNGSMTINKNEYYKILSEGSNLKAEIASLRGQIDAMQMRSQELTFRNKELEESVLKLSKSKIELEELQKQKDELFAIIIHDIKNPAALIKSLVELLRSYDLTAMEQQEIINDIVETTSKIVALSQEVSRILALEGGRIKLDIESCSIGEIIKETVKSNNIHAQNKNIQIYTDIEDDIPDIEVDPQKIQEVLDNLLSNAIKFTHKGGLISVRAYKTDDKLIIDVSDNGLGLTEEDIKNAFQRGAQLSAKPTAGETTTGLGLWIVKKLIDAHNGRVWVRSVLGKGSTFSFSLPLVFVALNIE